VNDSYATHRTAQIDAQNPRRVGVRAGQLLGAAGAGSERAVDAFVVAVADLSGGAVVATVDVDDLGLFASYTSHVAVADIGS
jgi:hypothetical protein